MIYAHNYVTLKPNLYLLLESPFKMNINVNIYMNIFGDTIRKKEKSNKVALSLKAGGRDLNENPDFF